VVNDWTTDHRSVLTIVSGAKYLHSANLTKLRRRNFKRISRHELESALEQTDWSEVYNHPNEVEKIHKLVVCGINKALDLVDPMGDIKVRDGANLYLAADTMKLMRERDSARSVSKRGKLFRKLRNRVGAMVQRDKRMSNAAKLAKDNNSSKVLWELSNAAVGKDRPTLPLALDKDRGGSKTNTDFEAAERMNTLNTEKVDKLCERTRGTPPPPPAPSWPPLPTTFDFAYCSVARIKKVVLGLNPTEALGIDGIPVSILKRGIEVLTSPFRYLVNRSTANGKVPDGLKTGIVHPVYKGGVKKHADPVSYRLVSILPAL
jgi:hypothetical protein